MTKIRIRIRTPRPIDRDDEPLELEATIRPATATIRPATR